MLVYLRRTVEVMAVAFLGGAVPTWLQNPSLDRVVLHGAVAAGVAAVYALVMKRVGEADRPTIL